MARLGPGWGSMLAGGAAALALSLLLSLLIGLFSLRVKTIFFAMITLAVASFFAILASQLSWLTGGEDGLTYKMPELLQPGYRLLEQPLFGVEINGKVIAYYLVFACAVTLFLFLLRVVNSPFGRVLQAIRENDFRAEAIGYRTVVYRTVANCLSALVATAAGMLYAIWLRYTGPDTTLSLNIMIDILLMVVIGGMGTMYGSVLGVTLFVVAQNYLQDLMKLASEALSGFPLLPNLVHPDRWLLWLGVLFILSVYYFPSGIVGRLRRRK
jgi:branched-chain amino acid transport system permease protein